MKNKSGSMFVKQTAGAVVFYAVIFIAAGRLDFFQAWLYAALGLVMLVLNFTVLKPGDELMAERSKPGAGAKEWDKKAIGTAFLLLIIMYVTAGIDSGRFGKSNEIIPAAAAAGAVLTAAGQLLFLTAQKQNRFFSSTVRIQTERGHTVCDTGLYAVVRHPAYMGQVIQTIGFPILFHSLWSIIPAVLSIAVFVIRAKLEDDTLKSGLKGYEAYSQKVKYRLVPFVW